MISWVLLFHKLLFQKIKIRIIEKKTKQTKRK